MRDAMTLIEIPSNVVSLREVECSKGCCKHSRAACCTPLAMEEDEGSLSATEHVSEGSDHVNQCLCKTSPRHLPLMGQIPLVGIAL